MRHLHAGRKLGVAPDHRKARLRSLTLALIEKETIKTTPARAKELRWFAERIVTLAKRGDLSGRRRIVQLLGSTQSRNGGPNRVREAVDRVYTQLVPRFQARPGGYTQILRLAKRRAGDNAELCVMRYLPAVDEKPGRTKKPQKPVKKVAAEDKPLSKGAPKEAKASAKTEAKSSKSPEGDKKSKKKDKSG
jgi:large subunit ribosomal protein L17